jgi:Fur family zinc uptake transcriptional regulator
MIDSIEPLGYNAKMTVSNGSRQAPRSEGTSGAGRDAGAGREASEAVGRSRGGALTPSRQRILAILEREGRPLGAYDLIEKVASETGKRPAPISIYRALDFLLENGFVHRLASRNMFLACGHVHDARAAMVFLICDHCGGVVEVTSKALQGSLAGLAREAGFAPRSTMMEIAGLCGACAGG